MNLNGIGCVYFRCITQTEFVYGAQTPGDSYIIMQEDKNSQSRSGRVGFIYGPPENKQLCSNKYLASFTHLCFSTEKHALYC